MQEEEEEFRGAEHEPVAKVSWLPTILWILGMIVLFNIAAGIVFYVYLSHNP